MQKFLDFLTMLPDTPGAEHQGKLLTLLEQVRGIGIAFFDDLLGCRYSDEKFAGFAGLPVEKMLGLQLQSLVPSASCDDLSSPENREMVHPIASRPLQQLFISPATSSELEMELTPIWINDTFFGVIAVIQGSPRRRSAQQASLRELPFSKLLAEIDGEQRLEKLFGGHIAPFVVLLDEEGRLEFISAAARQKLGIGAEDHVAYFISDDANFNSPEFASLVKDALIGREVYFPVFEYVTDIHGALGYGNGIKLNASVTLSPVEEPAGRTRTAMLFTFQGSETLTQPVAFMQRSESVAMLARGVAHEFNNIFAAIKGITSLLHSEVEVGGFADGYLGKMDGLVDRGVKLITNLTSYARSSETILEKVEAAEFLRNFAALVDFIVPKEVKFEFALSAKGRLECDQNSLRQGLFNLVQNSLDALADMPDKRIRIEAVEVNASELPAGIFHFSTPTILCVTIADSGPGIPAELATRIFEPYFSSKDPQRSSGLGLNVSQQIFRRHGGVLLADRAGPLGGAQFKVYLPLRKQP